jgi:hypothetical protein
MIAPKGKYAPSAQKIKIPSTLLVEEILTRAPHVSTVEADGFEHPDLLLVEKAGMQGISFPLPLGDEFGDSEAP